MDSRSFEHPSEDVREKTCFEICQWIRSLEGGTPTKRPPNFTSPYANLIVKAIQDYRVALENERIRHTLLDDLLTKLLEGQSLEEILDYIFARFSQLIPYDRIGLSLLDETDPNVAWAVYMRLREGEPHLKVGFHADIRHSSLHEVLRSGQPRVIPDLEDHLGRHPHSVATRLLLAEGMKSSLTMPLFALGRAVGFLFFSSSQRDAYAHEHLVLLLQIARKLSLAIEKARILEALRARNERIRSLTEMIAHDLRTPFSVVTGYLQMLQEGVVGELATPQRLILDKISKGCKQASNLLDDLMDHALLDAGRLEMRKEAFDVDLLVAEQLENSRPRAAAKQIRLELLNDGERHILYADRRRIGQVIDNFLSNALKYSPVSAVVSVRVERKGSDIVVTVRDQGVGLSEEEQTKLFDRFRTASGARPTAGERSVGLGLAFSKKIVQAHGGSIGVESSPGEGASFWFSMASPC